MWNGKWFSESSGKRSAFPAVRKINSDNWHFPLHSGKGVSQRNPVSGCNESTVSSNCWRKQLAIISFLAVQNCIVAKYFYKKHFHHKSSIWTNFLTHSKRFRSKKNSWRRFPYLQIHAPFRCRCVASGQLWCMPARQSLHEPIYIYPNSQVLMRRL